MRKFFKHTGKGHYIGSICIVCAESKEVAEVIIRNELDKAGLEKEKLDVQEFKFSNNSPVYFADGDY